jgi:DNA-binding CsgD family transcriptional regulator
MEQYLIWRSHFDEISLDVQGLQEIIELTTCSIKSIGFDYFAFGVCGSVPFMKPEIRLLGSYPPQWLQRYNEMNYAAVDPTIQHCKISTVPLRWTEELFQECPDFWVEANGFKLNYGLVQPLFNTRGCVGFLSLARERYTITDDELSELKPILKAFIDVVGVRAFEFKELLITTQEVELTTKEKEVIRWTADGKTSEEIGLILGITADAVNFHLRNIQKKIDACNRLQAVAYAIAQGCI